MALTSFLKQKTSQAGVTLIELIIVIAIIATVAAIVVFNFSDFTSNVSLRNLAQETALAVRKAQTYATSVKGVNNLPPIYPAYGITFSKSTESGTGGAIPGSKNFVLFADVPGSSGSGDERYNQGTGCSLQPTPGSECLEHYSIATEDWIADICNGTPTQRQVNGITTYTCANSVPSVDIVFVRPNPEARIYFPGNNRPQSFATIILQSTSGRQRVVTIYSTGQISTK